MLTFILYWLLLKEQFTPEGNVFHYLTIVNTVTTYIFRSSHIYSKCVTACLVSERAKKSHMVPPYLTSHTCRAVPYLQAPYNYVS